MSANMGRCPKCQGEMVQGFVPEMTAVQTAVSFWVEGPPKQSRFDVTKGSKANALPIGTFRCAACGYLESYARPEFAAESQPSRT
jgi:hypothetical protein